MVKMYSNKFVVCVIVGNKPQHEKGNTVELPIGQEYKIRLRNKHNVRAVAKFSIDGEDASGPGYVIPANSFVDIERFSDVAKRFKFVSAESEAAIDYGKNNLPSGVSGVIEVKFYLEEPKSSDDILRDFDDLIKKISDGQRKYPYNPKPWNPQYPWWDEPTYSGVPINPRIINYFNCSNSSLDVGSRGTRTQSFNSNPCNDLEFESPVGSEGMNLSLFGESQSTMDCAMPEAGVTVEGSHSFQNFSSTYVNYDENNYTTVKIYLKPAANSEQKANDVKTVVEWAIKEKERLDFERKNELRKQAAEIVKQQLELKKQQDKILREINSL